MFWYILGDISAEYTAGLIIFISGAELSSDVSVIPSLSLSFYLSLSLSPSLMLSFSRAVITKIEAHHSQGSSPEWRLQRRQHRLLPGLFSRFDPRARTPRRGFRAN